MRPTRNENDLYGIASGVAWEIWFTPKQTFKIETTAQQQPAAKPELRDAARQGRDCGPLPRQGQRRATQYRDAMARRARVRPTSPTDTCTLYIDTSGEPLFKRGWRAGQGRRAAEVKTLAAAMLAASGWWNPETGAVSDQPLYDPCCGSGTIRDRGGGRSRGASPPGRCGASASRSSCRSMRMCGLRIRNEVPAPETAGEVTVFGSDVSHRMVDFAERNAERAGVSDAIEFRGGDALQRMPPASGGVIVLNPPYGERIEVGGVARAGAREQAATEDGGEFFSQLATHWKKNYAGLDRVGADPAELKLPQRMRLKESRRVPMWNGPIECRLFRFDMVAGVGAWQGGGLNIIECGGRTQKSQKNAKKEKRVLWRLAGRRASGSNHRKKGRNDLCDVARIRVADVAHRPWRAVCPPWPQSRNCGRLRTPVTRHRLLRQASETTGRRAAVPGLDAATRRAHTRLAACRRPAKSRRARPRSSRHQRQVLEVTVAIADEFGESGQHMHRAHGVRHRAVPRPRSAGQMRASCRADPSNSSSMAPAEIMPRRPKRPTRSKRPTSR